MEHLIEPGTAESAAQWHFSHVVRSRGLLFLSGVTGTRPDGTVDADHEAQFEQLFRQLRQYLEVAGGGFDDLVEITSYHVDLDEHFATFVRVKDRHLAHPYPAWTAIGATRLLTPGAVVELRAVAEDREDT